MHAKDERNQPVAKKAKTSKFKIVRMLQRVRPRVERLAPFVWGVAESVLMRTIEVDIYVMFGFLIWNALKLRLIRNRATMMLVHFITLYVFSVALTPLSVVGMFVFGLALKRGMPAVPLTCLFLLAVELGGDRGRGG